VTTRAPSKKSGTRAAQRAADAEDTPTLRFTVMLERPEGATTFACFRVPPAIMAAFAPRRRVPVVVTINNFSWRTTIAPYGSDFFVPLRAEVRAAIGADSGKEVAVSMRRDTAVRRVDVPVDLARALNEAGVRKAFDGLSFSHQKEYVQWVAGAKRPETRQRRIEATIEKIGDR